MIDQFLLYDQAIATWITNLLPPLLEGRTTDIMFATPRRQYSDVKTGRVIDNKTLTFPRIAITRLDEDADPDRSNAARIRRLGPCHEPEKYALRSAKFPAPINMMYQIDLATRFVTEMNRWTQKLLLDFSKQYIYLTIRPDDVWQNKTYAVFLDGIANNSDLDPGTEERSIRKSVSLRAECWVFDQDFEDTPIVKWLEAQWRNYDDEALFDIQYLPPLEVLNTGDGITVAYSVTVERPPVLEDLVVLQTIIGGTTVHIVDDGAGNLVGIGTTELTSGTIDYTTGAIVLTFATAPDNGEDITITYFMDQGA